MPRTISLICGRCGATKVRSPSGQLGCRPCAASRAKIRYMELTEDPDSLKATRKRWRDNAMRWKERHPDRVKKFQAITRRRRKATVMNHYGGTPAICACCGESAIEFLTIDHIDGRGSEHRDKIGRDGSSLYVWLIRNGFPEGFQVLCMNCNFSKGHYGYCPHRPEIRLDIASFDKRHRAKKEPVLHPPAVHTGRKPRIVT